MKLFEFVQTAVRFAVCIPLIAGFVTGCASGDGSAVTQYAAADAGYTMTFDGGITGACERSGGTTVMRMTAPEHLKPDYEIEFLADLPALLEEIE